VRIRKSIHLNKNSKNNTNSSSGRLDKSHISVKDLRNIKEEMETCNDLNKFFFFSYGPSKGNKKILDKNTKSWTLNDLSLSRRKSFGNCFEKKFKETRKKKSLLYRVCSKTFNCLPTSENSPPIPHL
jgi:hypothetical protein